MKKLVFIAVAALAVFCTQGCRRSNDAIARDYCEKLREGLEKRDFDSVEKARNALDKYCTKLSDKEIEEMMESLVKYVGELKVDSVYAECMKEMSAMPDGGIVSAPDDVESDTGSSPYGNAMPDTVRF